jgi:hypothetical protein
VTTQTIMKARIASEIRRSNVTGAIASAITTAIEAYQKDRFHFNETRAFTLTTIADQEFYTSSDDADLGNIIKFDYLNLFIGDTPYKLHPEPPERIELLSKNGTQINQPLAYCWYGNALRLCPVPDQAYTVRIACVTKAAAPATDGEASNPWMTYGERLIRCRAKYELYAHVLKHVVMMQLFDPDRDQPTKSPTKAAFDDLKSATNELTQQGGWALQPTAW